LRRRQERAVEMKNKIDKIHEKLQRSGSVSGWDRYNKWIYGGAFVLAGGLAIYLVSKWF
jgi:hypothetical protein